MGQIDYTSTTEVNEILEDSSEENYAIAYLPASSDTTMTAGTTWYAISGAFSNTFANFELDTDKIKYTGTHDILFEIKWWAKAASDTTRATFNITASINGTPIETSKMGVFAPTAGEPVSVSGCETVTLSTDDTVQLGYSDRQGGVRDNHGAIRGNHNQVCTSEAIG